jgi:hypothetical protein
MVRDSWTNDGPSHDAAWRIAHDFPKDGFYASGNRGQGIYIVPSERLFIARFGYSGGESFDLAGDLRVMATVIADLKSR